MAGGNFCGLKQLIILPTALIFINSFTQLTILARKQWTHWKLIKFWASKKGYLSTVQEVYLNCKLVLSLRQAATAAPEHVVLGPRSSSVCTHLFHADLVLSVCHLSLTNFDWPPIHFVLRFGVLNGGRWGCFIIEVLVKSDISLVHMLGRVFVLKLDMTWAALVEASV